MTEYMHEHILKTGQQRPGSHLWLASPLKLLKHQLNRHHCGRPDRSNHLLLLFSDIPLRSLNMKVCTPAGLSLQRCVSAGKCVQVLFFFVIPARRKKTH